MDGLTAPTLTRADGARAGAVVALAFLALDAVTNVLSPLAPDGQGQFAGVGVAILVAATTGGWLLAPRARRSSRFADWAVVVVILGCWAVIAGAVVVGTAMGGSGFADGLREPSYILRSLLSGVFSGCSASRSSACSSCRSRSRAASYGPCSCGGGS
jgi:hypothetical protein